MLATDVIQLNRRRLLLMAAGATGLCGRIYGFAADFWNKKAPADWSPEEVHLLLNKSPWAKQVTAEVAHGGSGGTRNTTGGNNTGMGSGGMGGGGGSRGMGGGGMGGGGGSRGMGGGGTGGMGGGGGTGSSGGTPKAGQQFKGIVRWESAAPIQEAGKTKLDDLANHYVISVIGFPLSGRRSDSDSEQPKIGKSALDRFKAASTLTPKGKDAVHADAAVVIGDALLLGFSKDTLKLSPDDKEIAFVTALGRMAIKTKFTFKEMVYHESLAI
jgi:hypothetical protein